VERSAKKMTPGWETEEGQHNLVETEYDVENVTTRSVSGEIVESRTVRADVVWWKGAAKLVINAQVVNPAAGEYMKFPTLSPVIRDAAALYGEKRKRKNYRLVNDPVPIPAETVVPFVLEPSGRLGPSALSFVNQLFGTQTHRESLFINECAMLCA
jgi:hypothetical protein